MDHTEASMSRPAPRRPAGQREAVPEAGNALPASIDDSPRLRAQRLLLQAAFGTVAQPEGREEEEPRQSRLPPSLTDHGEGAAVGRPGRPDGLKSRIEAPCGKDRADRRRRADSGQPAALDAPARAQRSGPRLDDGHEPQLPREAGPVVRQRQPRLTPVRQFKGAEAVIDAGRLRHVAAATAAPAPAPPANARRQSLDAGVVPVPAGGAVQRLLDDQAIVALDPATEKTPEALRNEINANLASVSGGTTDAAQHGIFNNAGVGEDGGTRIDIAKEAPQQLPASVAGAGAQHALTKHAVANMMLPRDADHKIPMPEVSAALAVQDSGDPRWSGMNYQGKNLLLTLSPEGAVVTTYRKPWSEPQAQDFDRFANPEKYAKLAEKKKAERKVVKTAVETRDKEQKDQKAIIDALVKQAQAQDKRLKAVTGVNHVLLGDRLTGDEAADLELVKTELTRSLPKAPNKSQTGSKGKK